jgi:hypothetical protein
MQPILIDGGQFAAQTLIEIFNNLHIAAHHKFLFTFRSRAARAPLARRSRAARAGSRRYFVDSAILAAAAPTFAHRRVVLVHDRENIAGAAPAFGLAAQLAKQRADARTAAASKAFANVAIGDDVA